MITDPAFTFCVGLSCGVVGTLAALVILAATNSPSRQGYQPTRRPPAGFTLPTERIRGGCQPTQERPDDLTAPRERT